MLLNNIINTKIILRLVFFCFAADMVLFNAKKVNFLHAAMVHSLISKVNCFLGVVCATSDFRTIETIFTIYALEILNNWPNSPENFFGGVFFQTG